MCLLKIRSLLLIICKCLVITSSYAAVKNSVPQSPCPRVIEYKFDNNNKLFGSITSAPPIRSSNLITLDVQYTIGNEVQGDGKLEIINSRYTITEDVRQNKLILYKLDFPNWQNIPPHITKIAMNGNQICYGKPLDIPGIRTIKLQHKQSLTAPFTIRPYNEESVPFFGFDGTSTAKPPTFIFNPQTSIDNPITHKNKDSTLFYPRPNEDKPEILQPSIVESNPIENPFWKVCGQSTNTVQLIINGDKHIEEGEHPWVAALFIQDHEALKFICGATLISDRHVVTAAHCVTNTKTKSEDLWIVLGRKNIRKWSDHAQIIEAESTHPHPEYKIGTGHADIAVIRLRNKANITNLIQPICLWTSDPNQNLIIKKKGTVVGWGKDENEKPYTAEPSKLTIPVVSKDDCLKSNPHFNDITSDLTFCAGYRNNSGPCTGDSGSGFFLKQNGKWTLRGVVSTALADDDGSCDVNEYVVYADAAGVTEWLLTFLN